MRNKHDEQIWDVYKLTNTANGKAYIGITSRGWQKRWRQHLWTSTNGKASNFNLVISRALRKYGADAFDTVLLYRAISLREAISVERGLIAQYGTMQPSGYNVTQGGEGMSGYSPTPERRAAQSAFQSGRTMPPEAVEKTAAFHRGRKRSAETCARIGAFFLGKHRTPEAIEKTASKIRNRKRAPEFGAKISATKTGHKREMTPTLLAAMKANLEKAQAARWGGHEPKARERRPRGHPHTDESKAKISAGNRGKTRTPEQRKRLSEAKIEMFRQRRLREQEEST